MLEKDIANLGLFFHSQTLAAWGGPNTPVGIGNAQACWTPFSLQIYYCHLLTWFYPRQKKKSILEVDIIDKANVFSTN